MKRSLTLAIAFALVMALSSSAVFAEAVSASFNKININVNGVAAAFSGEYFERSTGSVPYSILYKGTTYLPLAKVCEFVGKDVAWDGASRTVLISTPKEQLPAPAASAAAPAAHEDVSIDVTFNSLTVSVNGQVFAKPGTDYDRGGSLVPYSLLYRGTTYLPLAAVCSIVGKDVSWDGASYTASVLNRKPLTLYAGTDVPNFGELCGLPKAQESGSDDVMVYNYYNYNESPRLGSEREDMQKFVAYLFDAGYAFSFEDSKKLFSDSDTTLYAYRNSDSGRVVVIGILNYEGLYEVTVSYTR